MEIFVKLVIVWYATVPSCWALKLTNIDYLGLGYDAILGNPHSDLHDPGFLEAVLQLEYRDHSLSSDGKWLIPDKVQALQTVGCSYETDTTEVMGSTSYQNSLSVDAEVHGSGWEVKFSASAGFKEIREGTTNYLRMYVSSVGRCVLYRASIKRLAKFRVTDVFADAVDMLPVVRDDVTYLEFISVYGTHYASALDMGAKTVMRSEFEQTAWTTLEQDNFNFRAGADASFMGFTGGASSSTEEQRRMAQTFESKRTTLKVSYMGSHPSSDGRWETWAQSTGQSPYPIAYELRPLTDIFSPRYLPNISLSVLTTKGKLLNETFAIYCRGVPNCGLPGPDRVPVRMDRVNTAIVGVQRISCRPGYSLLSCGIDNLGGTYTEAFRSSYPVDAQLCECYDYFGAQCIAWCTNAVEGFQVAVSSRQTGTFRVDCAAGNKVLGCNIVPRASQGEKWRQNYPTDDGNGCMCYDYFGAQCYASCASNIRNHEVLSQYGHGVVTVTCSPNNYVLGCGSRPGTGGPERWRTYYVASLNTCQCYDYFGITCYALCGQFT